MSVPNVFEYRLGMAADALCVGALATQVDTYATEGISSDLAREAFRNHSPEAVLAAKSKRNSGIAIDRAVSIQKGSGDTLPEPSSSEIFDYG